MKSHFGPYDISRELGRGAMGVVYLAVHRSLQRECALKTIGLKFDDPNAAERFIHEGQAVAKLGKHPNIVQVFDAGIVDGTPYLAMDFTSPAQHPAFRYSDSSRFCDASEFAAHAFLTFNPDSFRLSRSTILLLTCSRWHRHRHNAITPTVA